MNKLIIDFNDIFKKFFDNFAFFDLNHWINTMVKKKEIDEVFVVIDSTNKAFTHYVSELEELKNKNFYVEIVNSKMQKVSFSEIKIVNLLYKNFMKQGELDQDKYFLMTSNNKYFETMEFLVDFGGQKFGLIAPTDINIENTENFIDFIETFDVKTSVTDKFIINEILKAIKWGEKNSTPLTFKKVLSNCLEFSKISPEKTETFLRILIANKLILKDQKDVVEEENKKINVLKINWEKINEYSLEI